MSARRAIRFSSSSVARIVGRASAVAAMLAALSGGECHVHYSSSNDTCLDRNHDGICDDRRNADSAPSTDPEALTTYRIVPATDLTAHPVRRLVDIEGTRAVRPGGGAAVDAFDFRWASDRILDANSDLVGLPEGAGWLVFDAVEFTESFVFVSFRQQPPAWAKPTPAVEWARLLFVFERDGALREVDNRTWVRFARRR
ncbi:MAG: hypothetical protein HYR85_04040 [Planctomycetes bacterium]|nr:hypothetical protein [Planctomycetota bacterium]MBI3844862.1 hypothetical protein [Planctomycetota bacterium]